MSTTENQASAERHLPPPTGIACSPTPTPEEAAVVMAAVEALWPKPVVVVEATPDRSRAWRFSGRWWSKPVPARRDRPWR